MLFWRGRLKIKKNDNNGEYHNDPNDNADNAVGENVTESQGQKTVSGWVIS